MRLKPGLRLCAALSLTAFAAGLAHGQSGQQVVKPPKMQLWMDASTGTMAGMPDMDLPGVGGLMGMMGGGKGNADAKTTGKGYYGAARGFGISPPRILDIAFWNSLKPGVEVSQRVPSGLKLGDKLPLLPILPEKVTQQESSGPRDEYRPDEKDKPKGRMLFYWGCSPTVRPGQPRIVDLSKMTADNAQAMGLAFNGA